MVYYRKYRPQKIEELDNEEIRNRLYSVLSKKSTIHAFLFTGPKGLGKTSAARIVAKVLNCEKLVDKSSEIRKQKLSSNNSALITSVEPCNKCYQCKSITNGTNLDVLEIDGASNRGIDEIRDLREKVRLAPFKASKKVYIIDEVHMLTTEAFNALLKTLEEPPAHTVFIFCTTEPQKVPATIVSRCFPLNFRIAKGEELVRSFKRIVKGENINVDKEALDFIASLSDGSFRDGAKILEEMVLMGGRKKITKGMVEEKYQISNIKYQIDEILEFLSEKNAKEALSLVQKIVEQGTDMKYFIEQMINELHSILLIQVGARVGNSSTRFSLIEIKELAELLGKAYLETKYAVLPQLPLELAIIEWCTARGPVAGFPPVSAQSNLNLPSQGSNDLRAARSPSTRTTPRLEKKDENFISSPHRDDNSGLLIKLIEKVKPYNHSVAGVLRGCTLKEVDDKKLVIEAKYKFHKERLEEHKTKALIEKIVQEITGKQITVSIVLK